MYKKQPIKITKEFSPKYNSPAMKLNLLEQGWKYKGMNNYSPIFEYYHSQNFNIILTLFIRNCGLFSLYLLCK